MSEFVAFKMGGGVAGASGVSRCASVWCCPVCSAAIRQERALELEAGLGGHLVTGGQVLMLTLTLRHGVGDGLARGLDVLLGSWRKVLQHRDWRADAKAYGLSGWVRATEITYGQNGWHPHLHILILTDGPLTESDRVRWEQNIASRWIDIVDKAGIGTPDLIHGCRLERCVSPFEGARYIVKEADLNESLSSRPVMELLRGDLKTGRRKGLSPWDLLQGAATGEKRALLLWWEYEAATLGRRCMSWSRGLHERLQLERKTDEQVVEDDQGGDVVALVTAQTWRRLCRMERDAAALATLERHGVDGLAVAFASWGLPPPLPPPALARG